MPFWVYPSNIVLPLEPTSLDALGLCRLITTPDSTNPAMGLWRVEMRVRNTTGGSLVANACYVLGYDGDEEDNPKVITAAAVASVRRHVAVATEAAANNAYTWVVVGGYYSVSVNAAAAVAKDDFLKLAPGTDADSLIKDGTALSEASLAIARAALASGTANTDVFIIGREAVINL